MKRAAGRALLRRALCVLALGSLAACSEKDPLTEIVVVVDSDWDGWDRVEARIDGFEQPALVEVPVPLPRRVSLVHAGGPLGPIDVTVSAFSGSTSIPVLVESRTGIRFERDKTRMLRVTLLHGCIDHCDEGMACVSGLQCVDSGDAWRLEPWPGTTPKIARADASVNAPMSGGAGGAMGAGTGAGAGGGLVAGAGGGVGAGAGGAAAGMGGGAGATVDGGRDGETGSTADPWSYAPSNFDETVGDVAAGARDGVVLDCGESAFDSTTLALTNFCNEQPAVTTVELLDGREAAVLSTGAFELASGSALRLSGERPVIIAAYGDVTIAGVLDASATGGVPGPGGDAACTVGMGSAGANDPGLGPGAAGGSGGGFGSVGGSGGNGGGPTRVDGGLIEGNPQLIPLRGGCAGGVGGGADPANAPPAPGGAGGGAVQVSARGQLAVNGTIAASGGGGAVGTVLQDGGGGGGSGGAVLLEGSPVVIDAGAFVTANGGGGGGGQPAQQLGSSAGVDGLMADLALAAGGEGSANGGNGGGGAAVMGAAVGGDDGGTGGGGGGGGGGIGRIRINGARSCTQDGGFSPWPSVLCEGCDARCPVAPPLGCRAAAYEDREYLFCTDGLPWGQARNTCFAVGLELVHIGDSSEDDWLKSEIGGRSWIGAHDSVEEAVWRWTDDGTQFWMGTSSGSAVGGAYAGWMSGEPGELLISRDCGAITSGGWEDDACDTSYPYVCEGQ